MWGRVPSSYSPGSLDLFLLDLQSVGPALFANVLETLARDGKPGLLARELFEALDDLIAVNRVELDEACPSAGLFGRNEGCSRSTKGVEHRLASFRTVFDGVGHESDRFHSRVHGEFLLPFSPERVDAGVVPDICTVASRVAEPEGVGVRCRPDLEDKDEFVLGAIERAHAAVCLVPDAEVFQLREHRLTCTEKLAHVAPVHADEGDGAVAGDRRRMTQRLAQERH